MKKFLILALSLLSIRSFANDLRCVSTERSSENHVLLSGRADQKQILYVNLLSHGQVKNLELLIEKLNPSENYVEIQGLARNMVFVGGGQMNFQLRLPLNSLEVARLKTITPVFNGQALVNEIELACEVQNLYRPLPVSL